MSYIVRIIMLLIFNIVLVINTRMIVSGTKVLTLVSFKIHRITYLIEATSFCRVQVNIQNVNLQSLAMRMVDRLLFSRTKLSFIIRSGHKVISLIFRHISMKLESYNAS